MLAIAAPEWIQWFDYPGLELWKFGNLAIFTIAAILLLRRPISEALLARREVIRRELLQAQADLDQAEAQLREAEALLARLNADTAAVQAQARNEAEAERQRLIVATEREMEKLKLLAQREIEMAGRVARRALRQYLANRSVELCTGTLFNQIKTQEDSHLISQKIG